MMRVFMFFVNAIFWMGIFIVPAAVSGFIAFWLYNRSIQNLPYSIVITIIGAVVGIALAERIRKRYGLDNFFGRLSATPDIDGGNVLDERLGIKKKQPSERDDVNGQT